MGAEPGLSVSADVRAASVARSKLATVMPSRRPKVHHTIHLVDFSVKNEMLFALIFIFVYFFFNLISTDISTLRRR